MKQILIQHRCPAKVGTILLMSVDMHVPEWHCLIIKWYHLNAKVRVCLYDIVDLTVAPVSIGGRVIDRYTCQSQALCVANSWPIYIRIRVKIMSTTSRD